MVVISKKEKEDCTFKIRSVQANRVYQVNNGYKYDKNSKKEIQDQDICLNMGLEFLKKKVLILFQ